MKTKIYSLLIILLANCCFGQTDYNKIVAYYNTEKNFNGTVLVATNGKIDYLSGIGISNRQSQTSINSKTKFKIASITKTFTAVLILQLYEQGEIDLNANFGNYYPTYQGEAKKTVTIQNLLTYSSGIPNAAEKVELKSYQLPLTIDEYINTYCSEKLAFTPGEKSNYSNTDYIILHKIIENITKKPYSVVLYENILKPLSMENTGLLNSSDIIAGLTSSYTIDDSTNAISADEPYFIENFFGAGAMYSTVEDLLKFDQAIFNYKLLNEATTKLMLTPNEKLNGVALGVWYADGYGTFSKPFIYRTGGILGSCSNWIHTIDDHKTIIVFNNTNGSNLYELSEQLYLVSNGQKPSVPEIMKPESDAVLTYDLENIKGTWRLDLRPDPASEPYYSDFILEPTNGLEFNGEFYGTTFTNGYFNTDWENLFFAFTTSDKENTYFHSGYIIGDKMYGISHSPERKFTSHWTGTKKQ
jgi:CubicO group peptidase (beta-lactamase class C family)